MATEEIITPTQTPTQQSWWLVPLYKQNKIGNDTTWQVGFDGEESLIMRFGTIGGVIRETTTVVVPKSNRDMQQQALLEARSRYSDKFRKDGYRPAGSTEVTVPKPMLANKWEPGKTKLDFSEGVLTEPKLDGIRMLAGMDESGEIITRSRNNKPFYFIEHITDRIAIFLSYLPIGAETDGELYSHTLTFNDITSIVRRTKEKHPNTEQISYYIFDVILPDNPPFEERYQLLLDAYAAYEQDGHLLIDENDEVVDPIRLVAVDAAFSEDEILALHDDYVQLGYEGIIIRKVAGGNPTQKDIDSSIYKFGRTNNMLKYKEFIDEEGEVVGVEEATGTEAGTALLVIRDIRGNEILMRFRGPFSERAKWLQDPERVIGKQATFRYQELSPDGVPRFPVGIVVRDYE